MPSKKCAYIGLGLFFISNPYRGYIVEDGHVRKQNFTTFGYRDEYSGPLSQIAGKNRPKGIVRGGLRFGMDSAFSRY
ncbi:MAG: hypothetical protein AAGH88_03810 [Planctomycetota bacterium]